MGERTKGDPTCSMESIFHSAVLCCCPDMRPVYRQGIPPNTLTHMESKPQDFMIPIGTNVVGCLFLRIFDCRSSPAQSRRIYKYTPTGVIQFRERKVTPDFHTVYNLFISCTVFCYFLYIVYKHI